MGCTLACLHYMMDGWMNMRMRWYSAVFICWLVDLLSRIRGGRGWIFEMFFLRCSFCRDGGRDDGYGEVHNMHSGTYYR